MDALSHNLADALARRINEVIPAGFRLAPEGGRVMVHVNGSLDGVITTPEIADDETRELRERLETAVYGVLNSVQDTITEQLRLPWPSQDVRVMAPPKVRAAADAIHLWYGDSETAPVLAIPQIPLRELRVNR